MTEFTVQMWQNPMAVLQASQAAASRMDGAVGRRRPPRRRPEGRAGDRAGARRPPLHATPAWSEEPVFDYLKQAYLLASRQAADLVAKAEGVDEATRTRAEFYTRPI